MKNKMGNISFFQMPLHYPRYTKEDYQGMPENILDRLLAEYGLPADGDLAYKRNFAIGAFLWPQFNRCSSRNASPEPSSLQTSSPNNQI
ncbi:hypothetical protein RJ641_005609 [Dillenia turbinata]|uniref:DUF7722 domain-containing protein n=1 Tax=Dillenia turbinata TaxID=194707 RepID=A0AAN8VD33_9MAGN